MAIRTLTIYSLHKISQFFSVRSSNRPTLSQTWNIFLLHFISVSFNNLRFQLDFFIVVITLYTENIDVCIAYHIRSTINTSPFSRPQPVFLSLEQSPNIISNHIIPLKKCITIIIIIVMIKNRVEWLVMILNFYSVVYYQRDVQTF